MLMITALASPYARLVPYQTSSKLVYRGLSALLHRSLSSRTSTQDGPKRKLKQRLMQLDGADGVCAAYCVMSPVSLGRVSDFFKGSSFSGQTEDPLITVQNRGVEVFSSDVVHVPLHLATDNTLQGHAFFFSSGAAVFWGLPMAIRRNMMDRLATFQDRTSLSSFSRVQKPLMNTLAMEEFDHEFKFSVDMNRKEATFRNDEIYLTSFSDSEQLLALSYGLAQSVKLLIYEEAIDSLVLRTRTLPDELAQEGKIKLSHKNLKRLIGELLAARYSVNLVSDILDTPEYFWQHAELENLHTECATGVELRQRARILDTRTTVIKDALDILNNELSSSSSDRVERAILFLIAVEVSIELARVIQWLF